jgi:CrcB protein
VDTDRVDPENVQQPPASGVPTVRGMPIDPDVEEAGRLRGRARARHLGGQARSAIVARWDILAFVAAGGSLGAAARYGVGLAVPHTSREFPWATFLINVTGCFALGLLMVLALEVWTSSRYIRPFFGVGLLGGYTTFSTYVLETRELLVAGQQDLAAGYLLGSLVAGLTAVWLGMVSARLLLLVTGGLRRHRIRRRRAASTRRGRSDASRADDVSSPPPTRRRR